MNSGNFLTKGLNSSTSFVGRSGPSPSESSIGVKNPIKRFSRKMPRPYLKKRRKEECSKNFQESRVAFKMLDELGKANARLDKRKS